MASVTHLQSVVSQAAIGAGKEGSVAKKEKADGKAAARRERVTLRAADQKLVIELRPGKNGNARVSYVQHISRKERVRSPQEMIDGLTEARERMAALVAEAKAQGWHEQAVLSAIPKAPTAAAAKPKK